MRWHFALRTHRVREIRWTSPAKRLAKRMLRGFKVRRRIARHESWMNGCGGNLPGGSNEERGDAVR